MDRFNVRVLDLEGGKRWLRHVVDADRGTDAYRRAVLRAAIDRPETFADGVVWSRTGPVYNFPPGGHRLFLKRIRELIE